MNTPTSPLVPAAAVGGSQRLADKLSGILAEIAQDHAEGASDLLRTFADDVHQHGLNDITPTTEPMGYLQFTVQPPQTCGDTLLARDLTQLIVYLVTGDVEGAVELADEIADNLDNFGIVCDWKATHVARLDNGNAVREVHVQVDTRSAQARSGGRIKDGDGEEQWHAVSDDGSCVAFAPVPAEGQKAVWEATESGWSVTLTPIPH
mgnify:CR=1 FL=1